MTEHYDDYCMKIALVEKAREEQPAQRATELVSRWESA